MKFLKIAGVIVAVWLLLAGAISWYLIPDNRLDCDQKPSAKQGCNRVDAIVAVSGGDTTARTTEAIRLYQDGWAGKLIFSGAAADKSGPSNAQVMRDIAIGAGVKSYDILLDETSSDTSQNAENTKTIFDQYNIHSAILVTSGYHAKRAMQEFKQKAPAVMMRSYPLPHDNQWSSQWWWLTPHGWYLGLSETGKNLVFYVRGYV